MLIVKHINVTQRSILVIPSVLLLIHTQEELDSAKLGKVFERSNARSKREFR